MRTIKFRAWNGEKIVYNFVVARPEVCDVLSIMTKEDFAKKTYRLKEWKVMQFTGLKDKKGKEIYEGDILKVKIKRKFNTFEGNVLVKYGSCEFYAEKLDGEDEGVIEEQESLGNYRFDSYDIEIIGNKFENPELLK